MATLGPSYHPDGKLGPRRGRPSEPKSGPGDPKGKPKGAKGCPKGSQKGPKWDLFLLFFHVLFWLRLEIEFLMVFGWFGMVFCTFFGCQFGHC